MAPDTYERKTNLFLLIFEVFGDVPSRYWVFYKKIIYTFTDSQGVRHKNKISKSNGYGAGQILYMESNPKVNYPAVEIDDYLLELKKGSIVLITIMFIFLVLAFVNVYIVYFIAP